MIEETPVRFRTEDGLTLAGVLRAPADAKEAVVFTGPFTGVKDQVVGRYAQALAERGFATLAFDHRNFGESEGTLRHHEDAAGKLTDLRAAVTLLRAKGFDRVGMTGICLGGGYALKAAAQDPRVSAVACVAAAFPGAATDFAGRGEAYREILAGLLAEAWTGDGEPVYRKAVSDTDEPAAMPGAEPFAYYGTSRSASPHWQNRVTVASTYQIMTLDTVQAARLISPTPLLIVHGEVDEFCSPEAAAQVYEAASEPKSLTWLPTTNHIDLYDVAEYVDPAVARLAEFFAERP
ncbi:hypothetical protein LX16_4508 [Stackebrandtia albiflava]|uniref:Serine aminopeptidase S33 domain-containing protein n=1 Tax=Stackebrandtia albiflava TaxID=406432 RepID=A0A562URN9_9ACTN|nr:alpha/beta hydrolase [Stackebrandtia albiflava]TWJ08283.1 hypothetical protein LX16_4508 [Stackebrandtia albiflava]